MKPSTILKVENLEQYRNITEELIYKITTEAFNVFDYSNSPYNEEFDEIFGFYQKELNRNSKYGISPSLIYFNDARSINAKAGRIKKYSIISFNAGTVVGLIQMFRENNDLQLNLVQQNFERHLDNDINELMYQFAVHYTFYHEMAHLVQKSPLLESFLDENLILNQDFSKERHLLELDADEFSAIFLGAQILQYTDNLFGAEVTSEEIKGLLLIGCSSILLYLLSFETNRQGIFYEEHSHPHPIIRLNWIVFTIIAYCTNSYDSKGIKININTNLLMNEILVFSQANVNTFFFGEDLIARYIQIVEDEALNMLAYYKKYQDLKVKNKKLAVNKWNVLASNKSQWCKGILLARMKMGF